MKTIYFLLLGVFCLLFPTNLSANDSDSDKDCHIVGHILDKSTGKYLPYVSVSLKGTAIGTTSDNSGHYFLKNLPEGQFSVDVSLMGYKHLVKEVSLRKNETVELNFTLEEDMVALDEVVVSANKNETSRKLAPTLVNVMSVKLLENTNSTCLAQGLKFQPGVRVENKCQNCGFQQVRINGMDGPYTQILIDSKPIFSSLAGIYGLEQIPANMVERVEVVRGGGSALFGASAVAGTINIITREPLGNSAELSHTLTGIGDGDVFENYTSVNASLVTENREMGLALFGQNRDRSAYDDDNDGYTELPELKSNTFGFRSFIRTGVYSKLNFEYHHIHEQRRGGDSLKLPPHQAHIAEELTHNINTGGIKFDYSSPNSRHRLGIYASAQHIDRNSYTGGGMDLNAYGATKDLTLVLGSQYNYEFKHCLFMPAALTLGLEYTDDDLDDNMWGYGRRIKQNTRIASGFFQNEWKNKKWSFLIGGRFDKHNMLDHIVFSPRVNLRFNPIENVNLRATYSRGFRAPQAYDEDLHIENLGGSVGMIRLADNFKEENSNSYSLSADLYKNWGEFTANLLVEGFCTTLDDVFALREIGVENGIVINERYNESGANVYGATFEGKLSYKKYMQLQAGLTVQRSRYKEARKWSESGDIKPEKKIFRTPDLYGYFTLSSNPLAAWSVALSGTYTGPMLVQHRKGCISENRTEDVDGFMELNFKTAYDIALYKSITLQVNAGLQNILNAYQDDFDKGAYRDANYVYGPSVPRSFFVGLKLSY